MWIRWTLPRLRIDQVMQTCLKYLLPMACGLFLGATVWQLFDIPDYWGWIAIVVIVAAGYYLPYFSGKPTSTTS